MYNEDDRRLLYKKDKGELIEIIIRLNRDKRHLENDKALNDYANDRLSNPENY